jgi:signal transduction histidine kinase
MAETSRDMMQKMNDIIWSLKPADEEKNSLHLRLANFSLDLFGNTDTQVHFDMDDHLDAHIEHAAARKNLLLIAREALNNAVKYSEAAHIWISLKKEGDGALLSIRDDGKGFDAAQLREGNGMGNMRRRAAQMDGSIQFESQPGKGVCIAIRLPIPTISYS